MEYQQRAIKLKYDIQRLVNSKWAYIVKKTGGEREVEAHACKAFLSLMDIEWRDKVTVMARSVLNRRKYELVKELPSPEDVETLTRHLIEELERTPLTHSNYRRVVVLAQSRLLLYNKRCTG